MKIYYIKKNISHNKKYQFQYSVELEIQRGNTKYCSTVFQNVKPEFIYQKMRSKAEKDLQNGEQIYTGLAKDYGVNSLWYPVVYVVR